MSIDEVLELAGGLLLVIAAGLGVAALVPASFTWVAALAVIGAGLLLLSVIAERAAKPSKRRGGGA